MSPTSYQTAPPRRKIITVVMKQGQTGRRAWRQQIRSEQLKMSHFALHPVTGIPWRVRLNS